MTRPAAFGAFLLLAVLAGVTAAAFCALLLACAGEL